MREPEYLEMKDFPLYVGDYDGNSYDHMFSLEYHTIYVVPGYYPKSKWQLWVRETYYKDTPQVTEEKKAVKQKLQEIARELKWIN
jgi:thioredoxin-related protein